MSILLKFVREIEDVFGEVDVLTDKKRAAYNRAAKAGLDKVALGQVIGARRKWGSNPPEYEKHDPLVRQYFAELAAAGDDALPRIRVRGKAA